MIDEASKEYREEIKGLKAIVIKALAARFPIDTIEERTQAGRVLYYISQDTAIDRLNQIFGTDWSISYDIWDTRVIPTKTKEGVVPHQWVFVKASVQYTIGDDWQHKDGMGSEDLEKVGCDPDMAIKSAGSSALKKAMTSLGVGLYLYDKEELAYIAEQKKLLQDSPKTPEQREKLIAICNGDLDKLQDIVIQWATAENRKEVNITDLHRKNSEELIKWAEKQTK